MSAFFVSAKDGDARNPPWGSQWNKRSFQLAHEFNLRLKKGVYMSCFTTSGTVLTAARVVKQDS